MGKLIDLTGVRFGRLMVIEKAVLEKPGQAKWVCKCDCGKIISVRSQDLRNTRTQSCGCLRNELISKHKLSRTNEYHIWIGIKARCNQPNSKGYHNYGGRGIKLCERWERFENFLEDMGPRPSPSHSIDRINVNGNYEPSNCRWATTLEQARNKRKEIAPSGRTGVIYVQKRKKWRAHIGGKHIGMFSSIDEAIRAREEAERMYWKTPS